MKFKTLKDKNKYYKELLLPEFKKLLPENSKGSFKFHYNKFDFLHLRDYYVNNEVLLKNDIIILLFKTYLKTKYNIGNEKLV